MNAASRRYEFLVPGELSSAVLQAFPTMSSCPGPVGGTLLFGPVRDTAELGGMLARLAAMGITVVEMRTLPDDMHASTAEGRCRDGDQE